MGKESSSNSQQTPALIFITTKPDDLAESIFSSQEEEEEHTTDFTAEELAFPPLATGIHPSFLARHATDLSLLDQPPAGAATEAVLSFGVPNLSWNNVQDFSEPMLQDLRANESEGHKVHVTRPNPPVEHYEGGGCSRGVLADDDNIHGPISESCGGHLYLPACHSLGNLNSCCHCGEEAVADYVFLPCFHKIHHNCDFIRIQRHMRTCPVCGQVF